MMTPQSKSETATGKCPQAESSEGHGGTGSWSALIEGHFSRVHFFVVAQFFRQR